MWNHRLVRKKYEYKIGNKKKISYYYGIHEAYYDKLGKVVAITQDPTDVTGETIDSVMVSYDMILEAFGQPLLDFDKIPEPGHDKNDAMVKRITKKDLVEATEIDFKKEFKITKADERKWEKEETDKRLKSEKNHSKNFIGKNKKQLLKSVLETSKKIRDSWK